MEDRRLQLYLFELGTQGGMLKLGNEVLQAGVASDEAPTTADFFPADKIWFGIHAILSASANISKLLWGGDEADRVDRERLRERLNVSDDSPLRFRHVRNKFEHVDEFIDEWVEKNTGGAYASRNVGGEPAEWGPEGYIFGHYDPPTGRLWFWQWEVCVPDLVNEGLEIAERAWQLALGRWVED